MRTQEITRAEMNNIVALCAENRTKVSVYEGYDSVRIVIPAWNRQYIQNTNAKDTKKRYRMLVNVLMVNRKKKK